MKARTLCSKVSLIPSDTGGIAPRNSRWKQSNQHKHMSSISGVSSAASLYQPNQNGFGQFIQSLNALGTALQSGNPSSAQSALSTFQQNLPINSQTSSSQPFGNNTQANSDYTSLVNNVQSGNTTAAQSDLAKLQADLKAGHGHGHHHHGGGSPPPTTSTDSTTTNSTSDTLDANSSGSLLNVTV